MHAGSDFVVPEFWHYFIVDEAIMDGLCNIDISDKAKLKFDRRDF
jgi:hypothetical protein